MASNSMLTNSTRVRAYARMHTPAMFTHEASYAQVLYFFTMGKKLSKRIEELQARLRRKRWKRRSACPTTRFLFRKKKAYTRGLTCVIANEGL